MLSELRRDMAASNRTSLSAGSIVRKILLASNDVSKKTTKIYPVVTDKAVLPYLLYRRSALQHNAVKGGGQGADTAQIDVICYTNGYEEGLDLAEAVRAALEYAQTSEMRGCTLVDAEEGWEDDAYFQQLVFNVKI